MAPEIDYKGIKFYIKGKRGDAYLCGIVSTAQAMRKDKEQGLWIPVKHFNTDLTLKEGENIDYVFRRIPNCLVYAGYLNSIQGIVRQSTIRMIIANETKKQEANR